MDIREQRLQRVRDVINRDCIARVPLGSKELPAKGGNAYYTWQFYLRRALLNPICLQLLCEDFWAKNTDFYLERPFQLAGVEAACVPIVTALVLDGARRGFPVNAFTIRKYRKEYGRRNLTEGRPSNEPVMFIDDLTSPQHNAFWHAMYGIGLESLRLCGKGYVLVLKKTVEEPRTISTSQGNIFIDSLFTLTDFILSYEDWETHLSKEKQAPEKAFAI
jgi:hypothetical protein